MQQFVSDGILAFLSAGQQIGSHGLNDIRGILDIQVHGDLAKQHSIITEFVHLKTQFVQQFPVA